MKCLALLALTLGCAAPSGSPADSLVTVEAFRAAREAGDLDRAHALLGADPRIWYGAREGAGRPWNPGGGGGRWAAWDEHFGGETRVAGAWTATADTACVDMYETNDYFALTESEGNYWRATYFVDGEGRIAGFMVSSAEGRAKDPGRREEFEAWARAERPREAEYLMPAGSIDPSGDRPARMRALLEEWRSTVGLTPLR
jgi:hypothetical protein